MSPALLDSQFATLEEPADALTLHAEEPVTQQVSGVKGAFPTLAWQSATSGKAEA
jgi:gluconate kinase